MVDIAAVDTRALCIYPKLEIIMELTLMEFRFATWEESGKANVFVTPQIFEVFGVTVRNP
jgi:hypothetical protein